MKIAIIGTGISGLTCAHYLHKHHDITLFEANDYVGGHTATVDVTIANQNYAIDTGFIVFNDRTYPNFMALLNEIDVAYQKTEMSFSVQNAQTGLEYNGHNIKSMFAQKKNWFRPRFYRFLAEIMRFNKLALQAAQNEQLGTDTLGEFLTTQNFSDDFCQNYILPMGAAIWSSPLADIRNFPLKFFLRFFMQHGLLELHHRPQWFVIKKGSREYVNKLIAPFKDRIKLNARVTSLARDEQEISLVVKGETHYFDQVIFACHSDQALKILLDPTKDEVDILSHMPYQRNTVILHTDTSILPKEKAAWASWNYQLDSEMPKAGLTTLTYNMNILQGLDCEHTFCVTLNQTDKISPDKTIQTFYYSHPVFSQRSLEAAQQRERIMGTNNSWFCGAYWYNGFHEDGVRSALDVVNAINALPQASNASINKAMA